MALQSHDTVAHADLCPDGDNRVLTQLFTVPSASVILYVSVGPTPTVVLTFNPVGGSPPSVIPKVNVRSLE